jgi:hypothetical protein
MKKTFVYLLFALIYLSACEKNTNNCTQINAARARSNSPITAGQTLKIWTNEIDGTTYQWIGPFGFTSQYASESISNAQMNNGGWYYLIVNSLDDNNCSKRDSVYVDVRLQQDTAPCSIAANTITYNNMADQSFSTVFKGIESTYSLKSLYAYSSNGDVNIYFAPYWRDFEPQDGVYTTYNSPAFDPVDPVFNKVTITSITNGIYWASWPDQTVYVSHVNGKLKVSFCNLQMSGSNGTSFTTIADGYIVETP